MDGVADITYKVGKYVLNNPKSFIPVMTASASTSLSTKGGIINYLIKKGLCQDLRYSILKQEAIILQEKVIQDKLDFSIQPYPTPSSVIILVQMFP